MTTKTIKEVRAFIEDADVIEAALKFAKYANDNLDLQCVGDLCPICVLVEKCKNHSDWEDE